MKTYLIAVAALVALAGGGCKQAETISTPGANNSRPAEGPTTLVVKDQTIVNGNVMIHEAGFAQDVWIIIQADNNGQPGKMVGRGNYAGRTFSNLRMTVEAGTDSPVLHISVRADNGEKGVYEPETTDALLTYQNNPVTQKINATYEGSSSAPAVSTSTGLNKAPVNVEVQVEAMF